MATVLQTGATTGTFGSQPSGGGTGASAQPTGPTPQAPKPQAGRAGSGMAAGGFSNLRRYIEANKPAGAQMAQTIGGKIAGQAEEAGKALGEAKTEFGKTLGTEKQRIGQATGTESQPGYIGQIGQAGGAEALAANPEAVQNIQNILGGTGAYSSLAFDPTKAQALASQVQEQAALAGSEKGRFQLLKSAFGRPSYTTGQQRLDQLLMQATPGAAGQLIGQAKQTVGQLGQQFGTATGEATSQLGELKTQAQQAQEQLKGALGTQETALKTGLEQKALAEKAKANLWLKGYEGLTEEEKASLGEQAKPGVESVQSRYKAGQLTAEDLKMMGLGGLSASQLAQTGTGDVDIFGNISTLNPEAFGAQQVASTEDVQRAKALQSLAGGQTTLAGFLGEKATPTSYMTTQTPAIQEALTGAFKGQQSKGLSAADVEAIGYKQPRMLAPVQLQGKSLTDIQARLAEISKMPAKTRQLNASIQNEEKALKQAQGYMSNQLLNQSLISKLSPELRAQYTKSLQGNLSNVYGTTPIKPKG